MRYASYRDKNSLWIYLLVLLVSACKMDGMQDPVSSVIQVNLLAQGSFCQAGGTEPSIELIRDDDAYRSAYRQTRKHVLNSTDIPPAVDFNRFIVVAVYMGNRNTAGYGVGLASGTASIGENNELDLPVSWAEPAEGTLSAQLMTSPCMLASMQKGAYSVIRAIDEKGRIRISLPDVHSP